MNPSRQPRFNSPRFELAQRYAKKVLATMGRPKPPLPLLDYANSMGWEVMYMPLRGPDGYMIKIGTDFGICIATDLDHTLTPQQAERCQYWTLAHEIGHILLHGSFRLNSLQNDDELDETTKGVLEVEAHWFASRLLIPEYVFEDLNDLDPRRLSDKCRVNLQPAQKRIDGLSLSFRRYIGGIEPRELLERKNRERAMVSLMIAERNRDHNEEMLDKWRAKLGYE